MLNSINPRKGPILIFWPNPRKAMFISVMLIKKHVNNLYRPNIVKMTKNSHFEPNNASIDIKLCQKIYLGDLLNQN